MNFVEGTTHITNSDKMKINDSRRSKYKCYFYEGGLCAHTLLNCIGSSHCKRYSENKPKKINRTKNIYY